MLKIISNIKYMYLIIVILTTIIFALCFRIKKHKDSYSLAILNNKAYQSELSLKNDEIRAYELTIDQLHYLNDSITIKFNEAIDELNIKEKKLNSLLYNKTSISKSDTIFYKDTIFRDISIDTIIGDEWYNVELGLRFPNIINISTYFNNETIVLTHFKKETIMPPKKTCIGRFFQRKHKVLMVDVIENNPYAYNKKNRYIEIIK